MLECLFFLTVGILLGYFISIKTRKTNLIGTLQIIESDELEQPYLFLELDKNNVDEICEMKNVSMRVKTTHRNSHN